MLVINQHLIQWDGFTKLTKEDRLALLAGPTLTLQAMGRDMEGRHLAHIPKRLFMAASGLGNERCSLDQTLEVIQLPESISEYAIDYIVGYLITVCKKELYSLPWVEDNMMNAVILDACLILGMDSFAYQVMEYLRT